jgi:hypothetical protein
MFDERFSCRHLLRAYLGGRDCEIRCDSYPRCPFGFPCAFDDDDWIFKPGWDAYVEWALTHVDEPIPYEVIPHWRPGDRVAYRVSGRSMEPTYYNDDLVVLILGDETFQDGAVCAVRWRQFGIPTTHTTLKRVYINNGQANKCLIKADNPSYGESLVDRESFSIYGVLSNIPIDEERLTAFDVFSPAGQIYRVGG